MGVHTVEAVLLLITWHVRMEDEYVSIDVLNITNIYNPTAISHPTPCYARQLQEQKASDIYAIHIYSMQSSVNASNIAPIYYICRAKVLQIVP